ncbi:HAF repeat-containing protein [Hamadaea tsunoensis]|uniref:HAF repeat-containing protein n=1 Tax=Hamadaea tsunoensis TaxID=53368 RepID=UPI0004195E01|nr:HAF repeat-containing protein [Hamadaea tsunoensis]
MSTRTRWALISSALLAGGLLAAPAAAAAPARYTIVDLGVLSTSTYAISVANAINNAGVVVGYTTVASGAEHAFKWANGTMTDLGTLPGAGNSRANAINDAGQVAGTGDRATTSYGYPIRWSASGVPQDLGGPIENRLGVGNGIDPAGRVVGGRRPADSEGSPLAEIFDLAGNGTYLANPPDQLGAANGINAVGQVVGTPAFVWQNGSLAFLPGLPGQPSGAAATAINIRGQVTGAAAVTGPSNTHAVLWSGPSIVDIGTLDGITYSTGLAVNAAGVVVGTADPMCQPCVSPRAWIWRPGGTITALDTLIGTGTGWTLERANGLNDLGQIVGVGRHNGAYHAFLLTPLFHASVNFQPAGSTVPTGYAKDTGAVYANRGNGLSYGWSVDNTANTRDRDAANSPDQRYDTLNHAARPTNANFWELAVPNGTYVVHVAAGDPSNTDSVYRIAVEGTLAVSGTPTTANHWVEATVTVTVTDGRLTVTNATGGVNDKLSYLDVFSG